MCAKFAACAAVLKNALTIGFEIRCGEFIFLLPMGQNFDGVAGRLPGEMKMVTLFGVL